MQRVVVSNVTNRSALTGHCISANVDSDVGASRFSQGDLMKHVGEAQPAAEAVGPPLESETPVPLPIPERSPDQDDFDASFRAGIRGVGALLRRRRKKE